MLLHDHPRQDRRRRAARAALFALATAAIWSVYFWWRPPGPMLGLRHVERWSLNSGDNRVVSLTFDDGPHPLTTPLLLAALRRADVKATFFVVGDGLRLYPELAQRLVREGHVLANHSQYHRNLTRLSPAEYEHEVGSCFEAIRQVYRDGGRRAPQTKLFRPPGGGLNRDAMEYLRDNDLTLAWYSNNVGDWTRPPAREIARRARGNLRPGDIILLHDAGVGTPQAVPDIVREARRRGLRFAPMPESATQAPPQTATARKKKAATGAARASRRDDKKARPTP